MLRRTDHKLQQEEMIALILRGTQPSDQMGVGSRLTAALAKRAREEGISSFTALALAQNDAMVNLLEELGEVHTGQARLGTVELTVALPEAGVGRLERLIRAVARGDVTVLFRRLGRGQR